MLRDFATATGDTDTTLKPGDMTNTSSDAGVTTASHTDVTSSDAPDTTDSTTKYYGRFRVPGMTYTEALKNTTSGVYKTLADNVTAEVGEAEDLCLFVYVVAIIYSLFCLCRVNVMLRKWY